jgi:hypothetical protein
MKSPDGQAGPSRQRADPELFPFHVHIFPLDFWQDLDPVVAMKG